MTTTDQTLRSYRFEVTRAAWKQLNYQNPYHKINSPDDWVRQIVCQLSRSAERRMNLVVPRQTFKIAVGENKDMVTVYKTVSGVYRIIRFERILPDAESEVEKLRAVIASLKGRLKVERIRHDVMRDMLIGSEIELQDTLMSLRIAKIRNNDPLTDAVDGVKSDEKRGDKQ